MRSVTVALPRDAGVIDVGQLERDRNGDTVLHPPAVPMVRQVVAALDRLPSQRSRRTALDDVVGYGAGLLAIRWGSLLALWMDRGRTPHPALAARGDRADDWNRITDAEMARVNIEASAGLAWVMAEGRRRGARAMADLCAKAIDYLLDPDVPEDVEIGEGDPLLLLSLPAVRAHARQRLRDATASWSDLSNGDEIVLRRRLANLVVHNAWRQRAEAFHGGATQPLGVHHARFTRQEAVNMEHRMLDGMAAGAVLLQHALGGRTAEMRLTLTLAASPGFAPSGWSEDEEGRSVRTPAERVLD